MAENSATTAKRRPRGRPFQKGQSGNPGGRPKGIVERVKSMGGADGRQYLEILDGIARGTLVAKAHSLMTGEEYEVGPSFKDRKDAAVELLNRGFGKPNQPISGDDEGGPIQVIVRTYGKDGA